MKARSRNFRTTGVVLCVDRDWFGTASVRRQFSDVLRDVFAHRCSLSLQDIGATSTNISVLDGDGQQSGSRCVAVFDQTYGSLRFTEQLYVEFGSILDQVLSAVAVGPEPEADGLKVVERIRNAFTDFVSTSPFSAQAGNTPGGYEQVFSQGSRVCYRESGALSEDVTIIEPTIIDGPLMYRVEVQQSHGPALRRFIPAASIEPSADADAWEYQWWNRETQTYENPPNEGESG